MNEKVGNLGVILAAEFPDKMGLWKGQWSSSGASCRESRCCNMPKPKLINVLAVGKSVFNTELLHALDVNFGGVSDGNGTQLDWFCDQHIMELALVDLVHALIAARAGSLTDVGQGAKVLLQDLQDHTVGGNQSLGHTHHVFLANRGRHAVSSILMVSMVHILEDADIGAAGVTSLAHAPHGNRTASVCRGDLLRNIACASVDLVGVDVVLHFCHVACQEVLLGNSPCENTKQQNMRCLLGVSGPTYSPQQLAISLGSPVPTLPPTKED